MVLIDMIGKVEVEGVGNVKVSDADSLVVAEAFIKYMKTKLELQEADRVIKGRMWTEEEKKFLADNIDKMEWEELAEALKRSVLSIRSKAHAMHLTKRKKKKEKRKKEEKPSEQPKPYVSIKKRLLKEKNPISINKFLGNNPDLNKDSVMNVIIRMVANKKARQIDADTIFIVE